MMGRSHDSLSMCWASVALLCDEGGAIGQHLPSHTQEDYSLTIFDIQVLYLPSFSFLEAIEYNEISKEETEKRYSFLKRTDFQLDFSKIQIQRPVVNQTSPSVDS